MPLTNKLNVAIIDSNPALHRGDGINKDDPPDPRVSTVTPATIALFKGKYFLHIWYFGLKSHCFTIERGLLPSFALWYHT